MKLTRLVIVTLIFFIVHNTQSYLQYYLGAWDMLITLMLLVVFLTLGLCWLYQLYLLIREKFASRQRLYSFATLTVILGLTIFFPAGIINYDKLEGTNWLVARREGAANCQLTIRLKTNKKFTEESICFGVSRQKGTYTIKNDTIFLSYQQPDKDNYQYGIIQPDTSGLTAKKKELLYLFSKDEPDHPNFLIVTEHGSEE